MSRPRYPQPPASEITPEPVYRARRQLMGLGLASPLLALAGCAGADDAPPPAAPAATDSPDGFRTSETLTTWQDATTYNNFYEFGTGKADPSRNAHTLQPAPWTVVVSGEAETTGTFALEDLLRPHAVQERIYRLRCVEGWSMVLPWQGVPLADVIKRFKPTSRARYVGFTTLAETTDRIMATMVTASWRYGGEASATDHDAVFAGVTRSFLDVFADHDSASVQASIWIIGRAVLERHAQLDEIRLTMPNLHHWLVDLTAFGLPNANEVFVATREPYGLIDAVVRRSDATASS